MIQIPMTPAQFQTTAAKIKQQFGVDVSGDEGQIEQSGVKASYKYDGANLAIDVLHKPFFLTEKFVEDQIRSWFSHT